MHKDDKHACLASLVNILAGIQSAETRDYRTSASLADDLATKGLLQLWRRQGDLEQVVFCEHMVRAVDLEQVSSG